MILDHPSVALFVLVLSMLYVFIQLDKLEKQIQLPTNKYINCRVTKDNKIGKVLCEHRVWVVHYADNSQEEMKEDELITRMHVGL